MRNFGIAGLALALLVVFAPTAAARDRDHDGLPDRWERQHHLSTRSASGAADPDRDHVDNLNEYRERTNPRDRDSDNDGRPDGQEDSDRDHLRNAAEDATGNDPRDRDTDDDGISDGREQAGVVTAYSSGRLTIDLANGGRVSGKVDAGTELRCESEREAEHGWAGSARRSLRAAVAADDQDPGAGDGDPGDEGGDVGDDDGAEDVGDDTGDDSGESSDGQPGEHHGHQAGRACPVSRLKAGARVHEAELEMGPDGARFAKIELVR